MNGEQRELRDEIVDLGTRYGIVTPYTSYLALEPDEAVTEHDRLRRETRGFASGTTGKRSGGCCHHQKQRI